MKMYRSAFVAMALACVATSAVAAVRVGVNNVFNTSSAAATYFIPLNTAGATTITFNLPAAGKYVLIFSAECSVDAPTGNTFAWTDLDILVNGAVVAPTAGANDAFCSSNGTAGFDGWETNSIAATIQGRVGANTVRIQSRINNGATGHWYGERSLIVHD